MRDKHEIAKRITKVDRKVHYLTRRSSVFWTQQLAILYDLFIWKSGELLYMNISIENFNIGRTCVKWFYELKYIRVVSQNSTLEWCLLRGFDDKNGLWATGNLRNFSVVKPPLSPGIPDQETPPLSRNSKVPPVGRVWIFSGTTHSHFLHILQYILYYTYSYLHKSVFHSLSHVFQGTSARNELYKNNKHHAIMTL